MGTAYDRLPPGPLTYEDYCGLPDDGNRWEILDGELVVSPSPVPRHQRVSRNLEMLLVLHVEQHRLGEILQAPIDVILELATPSSPASRTTIAQPDILFIRQGRESIVTERAIEGAPDLVVEILSPSTSRNDRTTKATLYARFGVPHYWIVDPGEQTFETYQLDGEAYRLLSRDTGDALVRSGLFPGLEIPLRDVWA